MGTWLVKTNGDPNDEPLMSITANPDRTVSLQMSCPDPVVVTTRKVEEIRWALGAAIADAQAGSGSDSSQMDV